MIGMTLCSGIGAPEVAAPWVDWRLASEIEAFPRAVLQDRFGYCPPETHNQGGPLLWADMTEITPDLLRQRGIPLPDLIVAGTPCQAFSVAGLRNGLDDARGNLTLKFVEICHAIVDARPDGKLAVLWENVPGVLSDSGNAFGCFLGGLVGSMDALPPAGGGSWPSEGMVEGPRARAAWAVLDAQWFGVAQRRRRVFVVVDFGNCVDPAAVLLEPDRLRGNTPPCRKAGEGHSASAGPRPTGGGDWPSEVAPTLNSHFGDKMGLENQHVFGGGGCLSLPQVSMCLNAGAMGRLDHGTETFIPTSGGVFDVAHTLLAKENDSHAADLDTYVAHTLRGEGFNASEDGSGRGTPLVPVTFPWQQGGTLGMPVSEDISGTLVKNQSQAVAFGSHVAQPWAVRRLTPTECHRLQGFPDDHCAITYRGKPAADGPQYKALGNSMAVPVIRWILSRMKISMEGAA